MAQNKGSSFFQNVGVDPRLASMFAAMFFIWLVIDLLSGGNFITPRNLWNLSVQTSVIAIMSTGMVLVIVSRNIDLSIGSLLGFVGMVMAFSQVKIFESGTEYNWILSIVIGLGLGTLVGMLQGFVIAYAGVPSFIVTLGGLLIFRGMAWWVTNGQTMAPMEETFQIFGGGLKGSIGAFWSRVLGIVGVLAIALATYLDVKRKKRLGIPSRPPWGIALLLVVQTAGIVLFVETMNAYGLPKRLTGGEFVSRGFAVPVLIAVITLIVMTVLANKLPLGRYIYSIGGNPESALLAGIPTKKITVIVFAMMGFLAAVASVVATARLNSGLNSTGTLAELSVIAAAVIGGTSLAGGYGTIFGAVIGALIIQSLQSGMVLLEMPSPLQNVVIGLVLVTAVAVDNLFKKGEFSTK